MNATTKFDINQQVWFICGETRKIKCERIKQVRIIFTSKPVYSTNTRTKHLDTTGEYNQDAVLVYYDLESTNSEPEFMIYATKEELLHIISQ